MSTKTECWFTNKKNECSVFTNIVLFVGDVIVALDCIVFPTYYIYFPLEDIVVQTLNWKYMNTLL